MKKEIFLFFQGGIVPFYEPFDLDFGKNATPLEWFYKGFPLHLSFVWRQSEFAFFRASTTVGALFYFLQKLIINIILGVL